MEASNTPITSPLHDGGAVVPDKVDAALSTQHQTGLTEEDTGPESRHEGPTGSDRTSRRTNESSPTENNTVTAVDPAIEAVIHFWRAVFAGQAPTWLPWLRSTIHVGKGESCWSPAGLWFLFALIGMVGAACFTAYHVIFYIKYSEYVFYKEFPTLLSIFAVIYVLLILPGKFDTAATSRGALSLDSTDINKAARRSCIFMAGWIVFGIISSILNSLNHIFLSGSQSELIVFFLLQSCATIPTLSLVLFALSLDVAMSRKHISQLAKRSQTLTVEHYRQTSEAILQINGNWQILLWVLAVIALYNMIGMVLYLQFILLLDTSLSDVSRSSVIFNDLFTIAEMGKETALLFLLTSLARLVNDEADDLVTDVFQWQLDGDTEETTEHEDSAAGLNELEQQMQHMITRVEKLESDQRKTAKESQRLELLMEGADLTVLTSRDRKDRDGTIRRLISTKAGGIRFRVLGIRWTTKYVQVLFASFSLSILAVLIQRYSVYW